MPVPIVSIWELTVVCATPHLSLWRQKYNVTQQSIYSTCNQIKTSSCSSSDSRYYKLVYLSVCVLVVFSARALTVVLQKIIIITNNYILWFNFTVESLWGFESKFACTNKIYKTIKYFFVAVYYHLVLTGKIKRDLQPVIFDRPFWHYINIKGDKTP